MTQSITELSALECLQASLAANRFLPSPSPSLMLCGDGDYRAVGAEFLGHFIHHADLRPNERVLDLGCGIGRMAIPLTQYLAGNGSYVGIDVDLASIDWCRGAVSSVYPNFHFEHMDLQHELYNPSGTMRTEDVSLPFTDGSFDLVCLVSVLTHLNTAALTNYAHEVSRLLAPGGRCFATAFMVNLPAREAQRKGNAPLAFPLDQSGPEFYANPSAPLAAVAFEEDYLVERFLRVGLHRRRPPQYGHWSGRLSPVFQDINVFE